jgi:short-subunit dehydrogenase
VEGFSESLQFEVRPFNIRVKIIEPGPIKTDFYDRSMDVVSRPGLAAYDDYVKRAFPNMQRAGEKAPPAGLVAKAIYRAATDSSWKMRYPANASMILSLRRILPLSIFTGIVRRAVLR